MRAMRIISIIALFLAATAVFWLRSQGAGEGTGQGTAAREGVRRAAEPQILIATEHPERRPSFAPDGRAIVFQREIDGQADLFLFQLDQAVEYRLTNTDEDEGRASFNPAGQYLAYQSGEIAVIATRISGNEFAGMQHMLIPAMFPAWRSNNRLLHSGGPSEFTDEFSIVEVEHPGADEINSARPSETGRNKLFSSPYLTAWPSASADGRYVAFFSRAATQGESDDIYLFDMETEEARRLTDHPANDFTPAIAPDGSYVVYASNRLGSGASKLFAVKTDGSCETQLTFSDGNHVEPSFSPDGRRIAFSLRAGGDYDIAVIEAPGPDLCAAGGSRGRAE